MLRRNALRLITLGTLLPAAALAREGEQSKSRLSGADENYITNTLSTGGVALATSRTALERAKDKWVKRFAGYEKAEQNELASILKLLGAGHSPETTAEADHAVKELKDLPADQFDKAYLKAQAEGHEKLLHIQSALIAASPDSELLTITQLVRGRVQEHIDLIHAIHEQLGA